MDDFDRLFALTRAAEGCNSLARDFIDHYGEEPDFSRFLSAEGQPYCQPAANQQARQHLDNAQWKVERLREVTRRWDEASDAHYFVGKAAADQRLPVLEFNGSTYPTVHEAARYFAEAVSEVLGKVEGYGDIEHSFELARLLADFQPVPDYYGQIQRESVAAEEFLPAPTEREAEDETGGQEDSTNETSQRLTKPGPRVRKTIEMIQVGTYRDRQIIEVSKIKNQQSLEAIKSRLKLGKFDLDWLTS